MRMVPGLGPVDRNAAHEKALHSAALFSIRLLIAYVLSLLVLGGLSQLAGCSWLEFLAKIAIQFRQSDYTGNGVGLSHLFLSLGITKGHSLAVTQGVAFFVAGWLCWIQPPGRLESWMPRTSLILISMMVWFTQTWLNYYALVALFLVPGLLREHRRTSISILFLYAAAFALHDFGRLYPGGYAIFALVKVAAYLALPMAGSAQATFNLAFVLDAQGRLDDAAGYYAQALQRDPGLDMSRVNLAIIHLQQSHPELAVPLLEESTAQNPYDVSTQFLLGGALRKVGREEEARARFLEALRIAPDFRPAQKALDLK
jgi:tetratricopeptide (TPR) repeat protein